MGVSSIPQITPVNPQDLCCTRPSWYTQLLNYRFVYFLSFFFSHFLFFLFLFLIADSLSPNGIPISLNPLLLHLFFQLFLLATFLIGWFSSPSIPFALIRLLVNCFKIHSLPTQLNSTQLISPATLPDKIYSITGPFYHRDTCILA